MGKFSKFVTKQVFVALSVVGVIGLSGCETTETTQIVSPGTPDTNVGGPGFGNQPAVDDGRRFEVRLQLASAYYQAGARSLPTALEEVNKALEIQPNSPDALSLKGLIFDRMGDPSQALHFLQRAASVSSSGDYTHNYGAALCQNKQYAQGIAALQKSLDMPSATNKSNTWIAIGFCHMGTDDFTQAENAFHQALALEPRNPYALFQLANAMFKRNDMQNAQYYFEQLTAATGNQNAQTLWLGIKIARQQGDVYKMSQYGRLLRSSFPNSKERAALERGDFNFGAVPD